MTCKVRLDKKKNRYVVDLRDIGGGQPEKRTKEEAHAFLNAAIAEHAQSGYINSKTSPTFGDLMGYKDASGKYVPAGSFLAHTETRVHNKKIGGGELVNKAKAIEHLKAMTYEGKPLADVRVADLRGGTLQLDLIDQIESGRAYKTARNILVVFKQAMKYCVLRGAINVSPAHEMSIDVPVSTGEDQRAKRLGKDRIKEIIAAANPRYRLVIMMAAHTGLRAGELCVLEWSDIDFAEGDFGAVHVRRSKKKDGSVGTAKTNAGHRTVDLSEELALELKKWKLNQPIAQRTNNLVFPSSTGQRASTDNWRERGIKKACKDLGVDVCTMHDMRHFFASILLFDLNESEATVTTLMGHGSIDFTRKQYGHWIEGLKKGNRIGQKLSAAFSG